MKNKNKCKKCSSRCITTELILKDRIAGSKYSYNKPSASWYNRTILDLDAPTHFHLKQFSYVDLLHKSCNICGHKWVTLTDDQTKSKKEIKSEIKEINKKAEEELIELNKPYNEYKEEKVKEENLIKQIEEDIQETKDLAKEVQDKIKEKEILKDKENESFYCKVLSWFSCKD